MERKRTESGDEKRRELVEEREEERERGTSSICRPEPPSSLSPVLSSERERIRHFAFLPLPLPITLPLPVSGLPKYD